LTGGQVTVPKGLKVRHRGHGKPGPDEAAACEPFLFRQIEIVRPRVIVELGKFAAQCLLRSTEPTTRIAFLRIVHASAKDPNTTAIACVAGRSRMNRVSVSDFRKSRCSGKYRSSTVLIR